MASFEIRTVDLDTVTGLRAAILGRLGAGPTSSPGDEHPSARHVAAFLDDRVVGVASVHPQGMPGGATMGAWRVRGVAVEYGHRGAGAGALLVERCLEHAAEGGATLTWAQVPAGSFGFFQRLGFKRTGDPVDDGGPHYLVYREARPLRRSWAI